MRRAKKLKVEFKFIKQQLSEQILENNLPLFELLCDKEDSIGSDNMKTIRKNLTKGIKEGINSVNYQMLRVSKLSDNLEKLHKWQIKRRRKFFDWLKDYLQRIEAREEQDFKLKYCVGHDEFCLSDLFNFDFTEEEDFGLENEPEIDDVVDETEEIEEEQDEDAEEQETDEEPAESPLLASSETTVSEERTEVQNDNKEKGKEKLGAFFGVDKNCEEEQDERSES